MDLFGGVIALVYGVLLVGGLLVALPLCDAFLPTSGRFGFGERPRWPARAYLAWTAFMGLVFVALGSQGGKCVEGDNDCYAIGATIGAFLVLAWLLGAAVLGVIRLVKLK